MNRLRYDLADLADEVVNVDLTARARQTSRKMRNRRAALATGAAVLVVLAGAAGIVYALRPPEATAPLPADSASTTTTSAAQTAPSEDRSTAAARYQVADVEAGTRWYLRGGEVHAYSKGRDTVTARIPIDENDEARCVSQTLTVSPGGKRIAWAEGSGDSFSGTLKVAGVDGKNVQTLSAGAVCLGAGALRWKGDDQLYFSSKDGGAFMANIPAGSKTKLPAGEQFDAASADGKWTAKQVGSQRLVTNGQQKRVYTYKPPAAEAEHHDGWGARGVSADGRYITVGWSGTDPSRALSTFAIVDTTTGKAVVSQESSVCFTAGGLVLVHGNGLTTIYDATMQKLGESQEPAALKDALLLGYARAS
ncbi:hypothetical protein Dvina_50910 [Dactylosporangium vinaceum]|uniref:Uncharacterized protein n=1 Tax=Dactylosporangium vinaceum TaxID=53362 RepID=A0ABV5M4G8_9ACTN|nr:hypothetical protein [Dactylosporangium vinaceum]UAB96169.1 hypothetical protein Dvina_50910 [Dactylosporangium vinaceum]